jgi:enoyl-CoA hydratase/carnithine racemase
MIDTIDHGPVRELRLSRPPANALSGDLITALLRALGAAAHEGAGAVVLSGAPGMFSAGLDVPELLTLDRAAMNAVWREFYALLGIIASSPIPIAAAMTGHSPAGGMVLAIFCDWRICAEGNWKLGLNEVQVGLPLPPLIYSALRRLVGTRTAEHLAVSGRIVSPIEAVSLGMVDEVVPQELVVPRAVAWCEGLLKLPRFAMETTRKKTRADLIEGCEKGMAHEVDVVAEQWWNEETQSVLRGLASRLKK